MKQHISTLEVLTPMPEMSGLGCRGNHDVQFVLGHDDESCTNDAWLSKGLGRFMLRPQNFRSDLSASASHYGSWGAHKSDFDSHP